VIPGWYYWTIHWLGSDRSQHDRFVFKYGVKEFGILSWLLATGIGAYASFENRPNHPFAYFVAFHGFLLLPISLWLGFVWGKVMRTLLPGGGNE
jgi:hypothetical protein